MKSIPGIIIAGFLALAGVFMAGADNEAEKIAKARQRVAQQNELEAEQEALPPLAQPVPAPKPSPPAPAPHVEPTPVPVAPPKLEPTPAAVPSAIPEGYEVYYEQVCDGTTCRMVPRLRPIARAAKAVASVLRGNAGCANPNCTCDPCECVDCDCGETASVQGEVEYRRAPIRNGARAVVTAPVRIVQRVRENQPVRTFFRNGGVFRRGCR